jgi:hypothetical protein
MNTKMPAKHVHASVLICTAKDDLPNALRALAQRLELDDGIRTAMIPDTHFSAGSNFVEGNEHAFAIVTIVEDVEVGGA